MAGRDFNTAEKKKLRELAGEAHRRELAEHLRDLGSLFGDWRRGHIDEFSLADAIHEFRDGASRDLYSLYNRMDPGFLVARAVARRLLDQTEISQSLMKLLKTQIEWMERHMGDEGDR